MWCAGRRGGTHPSVAVQVRSMLMVLPQPATTASLSVMFVDPHASVADAVPVAADKVFVVTLHSRVMSAGHSMTGFVVSSTVMI